jgi:hypothetical protein
MEAALQIYTCLAISKIFLTKHYNITVYILAAEMNTSSRIAMLLLQAHITFFVTFEGVEVSFILRIAPGQFTTSSPCRHM